MKKIIKKALVFAIAFGMAASLGTLGVTAQPASAEGKVVVKPYIQYTFDSSDTMLKNSGASASDESKNYDLNLGGNATSVNMCYMNDVEFKDNSWLYLEGENNPFANGDLTDFTLALEVSLAYSSWYGSVVSWDGVTGDADAGDYGNHKYMRVTSAWRASDADWLRFIDNQTWGDENNNSIANKPHWEAYGRGSKLYTGDRTVSETYKITLLISVDKDKSMTAKTYMGVNEGETITMDLTNKNWNLYNTDAIQRFTLGAAYDSRATEYYVSSKIKGRMDNVRIYDFAMTEEEMEGYAISEDKQHYVDGVEVDTGIVGGSVTVDKQIPAIGEVVTITPTADANAELVKVTVNGEEIQAVGGVYQATMVEGGLFVSAEFVRSFALTVDSNVTNGTITLDSNLVKEGEMVTFTVTPNSGYGIKNVTMNGATVEESNGVYSFVMPERDAVVSAEFAKRCVISVKDGITGGTVTLNKTESWAGDSVIITIKADEGYEVKKVTVNGVEVEKSGIVYKFTVTDDSVVDVKFGKIGESNGCNGSVAGGGLTAVVGAVALALLKKKRKENN